MTHETIIFSRAGCQVKTSSWQVQSYERVECRHRPVHRSPVARTDLHIGFGGHILLGGLLPVTDCEPPNSGASGGTRREAFPEMLFAPGIINGPTGRRIGR